ncbi:hypothetical protein HXX76_006712 [Chlamydomonas incerta]|uniref:Protein kinase domain-containing protein n=1 Tax=Chlamydomonas incerta TaxID=51695 RepID=A0A835W3Y9_CHLIN|nr:hypothetical protein HXX76_006712 [Chlamydomonas incerta]|eukprot:KAG2436408.1 hypothetical protein HXX76_006712 [Chlamydomonas incerta]
MATDVHATPPHVRTMLPALPSQPSEDGLGNPRIIRHERQGWREVLTRVGAIPNKHMLMLVQELCDAGSLGGAIRQGIFRPKPGVRTEALARRVLLRTATELCRGMVHIHTANVLHGDLKPANVLLARSRKDRRGYTVKVADFGLSKLLHADGSRVDSSAGGTLAYMSPEAFNGFFSRASDVYAFGMLLYEMVTGERPYEHMIPAQVMMGVSFGGLRPDWPVADWPELSALGARCLAQNPGDRPTFRELAEELVGLEEGLRAANKRLSADQVVALPELSAQASSGRAAYAASGASSGKALRGTSSLTPQTPVGVNSAPGLPSSGGPSEMLGGSSVPSAAANATACALSSIGVLAAIPEPLESATFSTAAAMIAAAQGLPAGTAADALAAGTAATAGTAGPGAADAVEAKSAHATCVQIAGSVIGLQAMAALDTAQEATNQLSTDSGRHDQLAQLHQEGQHVREAAGRGPYVQQGEIQAADMADVSPWTAATAVGAEDVELQGLAGPHTPPGW